MPLVAGSIGANGNFVESDSLAKAIDDALPRRPEFGQKERRELLVAIATGLINYLKAHDEDSFSVTTNVGGTNYPGKVTIS